jgi:ABC-2 type transport system permease protein
MLRSVFTKTLREQRWTLLIWSLILVVVMTVGYASFNQVDPAQIESLVENPAFKFLNDPVEVGTPSGLVTFRYGFFFSLLLGVFAVLLGGRLVRGEEARGSLELILARPRGRRAVLLEKVAASAVILLVLGVAYGVGAMLGELVLDVPVTIVGGLLSGLNLSLLLFFYAMLALALSQYTRSAGAAAGISGALFGIFFILDGTGRIESGLHWIRWFSPNYYYDLSKPLITSYGTNVWAMLVLLLLGLLLLAAALRLFERRDIGAVVPFPLLGRRSDRAIDARTPDAVIEESARDPWLRNVFARSLRAAGPSLGWWTLGIFLYAVYGAGITKSSGDQLRDVFQDSDQLKKILGSDLLASNAGLISLFVFLLLNIVALIYALVRANAWVSDQDNGRLDLLLSRPQPRWRVAVQAYGATLAGFAVMTLALEAGITLGVVATGLSLSLEDVFGASLALLPPMALVAGAVYALGARFRSNVVLSVVGGYLGLAYFFDLLWAYLGLPGWMHNLSIFSAYGTPIVDGVNWLASLVMLGLAALATAAGVYLFQTGDLRQGG